jgi:SAM-dependent methyltransferase
MTDDNPTSRECSAAYWGGLATRWRVLGPADPATITQLQTDLGCEPGALVLDVGCGAGRFSIPLALAGYRVVGVDLAPEMIAQARELAREHGLTDEAVAFVVGDAEHLDAADASVDAILCRCVLDHVQDPGAALVEFWRVLRPGGRLMLWTLGAYSPVRRQSWRRFLPGRTEPTTLNGILPWEVEALLGELGWRIVGHRSGFGPTASGVANDYTQEQCDQLDDRILKQTIATGWGFVAEKSTGS